VTKKEPEKKSKPVSEPVDEFDSILNDLEGVDDEEIKKLDKYSVTKGIETTDMIEDMISELRQGTSSEPKKTQPGGGIDIK